MDKQTMKPRKTDRRTKYTVKAIMDSYMQLLQEKPKEKIRITEICERAEINRCTFYLHFEDINSVEKAIEQSLIEKMNDYVKGQPTDASNRLKFSTMRTEMLLKDEAYVTMVRLSSNSYNFVEALQSMYKQDLIDSLPPNNSLTPRQIDIIYRFITGGIQAITQHWVLDSSKNLAEENAILDKMIALLISKSNWF